MKFNILIVIIFCLVGLFTSNDSLANDIYNLDKNLFISDTTLDNAPATIVYLGGDDNNYCSVTINEEIFSQPTGAIENSKRNNESVLSVNCQIGNSYYVISSKHKTIASIQWATDEISGKKSLRFNADLVTPKGKSLSFAANNIVL
ncbi:hypothetical protein [Shewanella algae]|uniref:hypothetical protein n=1 Tax=Shewanella algae TaxID=38313 RepID=UPI001C5A5A48|nr:hypothetical protein [Shewanella algae]